MFLFVMNLYSADSYKGYEWGCSFETITEAETIIDQNPEDVERSNFSFRHMGIEDLFAWYFNVPKIEDGPESASIMSSFKGKTDPVNKFRRQLVEAGWYHWDDVFPTAKIWNTEKGLFVFYDDRYFMNISEIKPSSSNNVLKALIRKYGKPIIKSTYCISISGGEYKCYNWVSGDTVIFFDEYTYITQKSYYLIYMSKTISDEIKNIVKTNVANNRKERDAKYKESEEKDLSNVE